MIEQFSLQVACLKKSLSVTLIYIPSVVRAKSPSDIQKMKWNMGCGQLPNKRAVVQLEHCVQSFASFVGKEVASANVQPCSTEPSMLKVNWVGSAAAMQAAKRKSLTPLQKGCSR